MVKMISRLPKWVNAVGLELEGGWSYDRKEGKIPEGSNWHGDGSVYCDSPHWCGEIVSKPYKTWSELYKFVLDMQPDVVNESMGTHMHISFKSGGWYSHLANIDKYQGLNWISELCLRLKRWGEDRLTTEDMRLLNKRISKSHGYCKQKWTAQDQIKVRGTCRYTVFNFCAWEKHKTLEVRLLPALNDPKMLLQSMAVTFALMNDMFKNFKGEAKTLARCELALSTGRKGIDRDVKKVPLSVKMKDMLIDREREQTVRDPFILALRNRGLGIQASRPIIVQHQDTVETGEY